MSIIVQHHESIKLDTIAYKKIIIFRIYIIMKSRKQKINKRKTCRKRGFNRKTRVTKRIQFKNKNRKSKKGGGPFLNLFTKKNQFGENNQILFTAIIENNIESFRRLIDSVDVDIQDKDGNTALILAASNGDNEICGMILSKGCNVDIQDNNGFTALMWAAKKGHNEICDSLINKGCDVDIQDKYGFTALMWAAWNGHNEICRLLISKGCNVNTKNNANQTAYDLADDDTKPIISAATNTLLSRFFRRITKGIPIWTKK
jgi:hypothetical protein